MSPLEFRKLTRGRPKLLPWLEDALDQTSLGEMVFLEQNPIDPQRRKAILRAVRRTFQRRGDGDCFEIGTFEDSLVIRRVRGRRERQSARGEQGQRGEASIIPRRGVLGRTTGRSGGPMGPRDRSPRGYAGEGQRETRPDNAGHPTGPPNGP